MPTPDQRASVVRKDLDNVIHPIVPHKQLEQQQLVIVSAKDSTVVDADGREYLDGMAGLWCVNIGYGRTELADVAAEQMRQLSYYPHTAMNLPAAALAEKINGLLGGDNHVYFVSSGSEANEAAFKFARQYARHEFPQQNRYKTISRYYGYHGTTLATLAAGGMGDRKMKFEPLSGNEFVHVAPPYCYRCPFGLEPTELRAGLREEHGDDRPGRGTPDGGRDPHRAGHERGRRGGPARRLPARGGRPLQAARHPPARGRGHQRLRPHRAGSSPTSTTGVKPDIVTVAKGISSAYLPMAATVVRNSVFKSFIGEASENRQVNQVNTYGGHPVAAAVALRNIEIMLEEKLAQRSAENGAYLLDGLKTLMRHPWVGDVRGKGLYAGVELVIDRMSKAVMPAPQIKKLVDRCQERGVIVGRSGGGAHLGNTLVLAPPLVLTRPEIDRIVSVLDQTIPEVCPEAGA